MSIKKIEERLLILMQMNLEMASLLGVSHEIQTKLKNEVEESTTPKVDRRKTAWTDERKEMHAAKMAKKWEAKKAKFYIHHFSDRTPYHADSVEEIRNVLGSISVVEIRAKIKSFPHGFAWLDPKTLLTVVVAVKPDKATLSLVLEKYNENLPDGMKPYELSKFRGGRF